MRQRGLFTLMRMYHFLYQNIQKASDFCRFFTRDHVVLFFFIPMTFMLTACWEAHTIEDIQYATAIGVDFEDDHYVVYVQLLEPSKMAKQEGINVAEKSPVWVGIGKGPTINIAMNQLYEGTQQEIYWGHISSIIFSEAIIAKGIEEVKKRLYRFSSLRYTPWIFGTKEPLKDILSHSNPFHLSPMKTILYMPKDLFNKYSKVPPLRSNQFYRDFQEVGSTALLPNIIQKKFNWFEEEKTVDTIDTDGAFILKDFKLKGWMSQQDLKGYRWVNNLTERAPLVVGNDNQLEAVISILRPKNKIEVDVQGTNVYFTINLKIRGYVIEQIKDMTEEELVSKAKKQIEKEVRNSYLKSLELEADILQLERALFHKNPRKYNQLLKGNEKILDEDSLKRINVDVDIIHSGQYKFWYP